MSSTGGRRRTTTRSDTVTAIVSGGVDITMRRKRERELERERDVQTTVFETIPSVMVVLASDGTIRDRDADDPRVGANRAFRLALGWPDSELVGRPFLDLVEEDDDGRAARAIASAAEGIPSDEIESELAAADGGRRAFAWAAVPIADVTGRTDGLVLVSGMDVTERRRLEDEKERERVFLNAIANNAPSLLCLVDHEGVITERGANIAFERTLEFDPSDIGGQVFWEAFVDPAEADQVRATIMRIAGGEPPAEHDNTWMTKTGRRLSMAWTCTPLPVMDERTLLLITAVDVTERERSAEELRASRTRLVRAEETARRVLERNLHDGAQQRLVALSVSLRLLESRIGSDRDAALELLAGAQRELAQTLEELRELARGIHPAVLTDRGLRPALETLASRTPIPVDLVAPEERLPPDVEAAAYYVVAESLTNVAKYARRLDRPCVRRAGERRSGRHGLGRWRRWGRSLQRLRPARSRGSRFRSRRDALDREPEGAGNVDPRRDPARRIDREIHSKRCAACRQEPSPSSSRTSKDRLRCRRIRASTTRRQSRSCAASCATPSPPTGARRPMPWVTSTSPRSWTVVRPRMQRSPRNAR